MSRTDLALIISGISLGVALATFVWRIAFDVWLDRARVKVTLAELSLTGPGSKPSEVYVVTATNRGRQPTTVTSLWLVFGRPYRGWWRVVRYLLPRKLRKRLFTQGIMLPDTQWLALNSTLPKRLDVGEQVHTYYSREAVHKNLKKSHENMHGSVGVTTGSGRTSKALKGPTIKG